MQNSLRKVADNGVAVKTSVTLRHLGGGQLGIGFPDAAIHRVDILNEVANGDLDRGDVEVVLTMDEDGEAIIKLNENPAANLP